MPWWLREDGIKEGNEQANGKNKAKIKGRNWEGENTDRGQGKMGGVWKTFDWLERDELIGDKNDTRLDSYVHIDWRLKREVIGNWEIEKERMKGLAMDNWYYEHYREEKEGTGRRKEEGRRGKEDTGTSYDDEDRGVVRDDEDEESNTFITSILRTNGITVSIDRLPIRPEKKSSTRRGEWSHLKINDYMDHL